MLLTLAAPAALAQFSGNAALLSDYRYRGVSLTDGKPAAQLSVVYDDPRAWYAGLIATTALAHCARDCGSLQSIAYAGYAARQPSGVSLEAGATFAFSLASHGYDYPEIYAGLGYGSLTARVYASPRYFGADTHSIYAEVNDSFAVMDRMRLLAHVGVLHVGSAGDYPYASSPATRADVLLGAVVELPAFDLTVSWQHAGPQAAIYPAFAQEKRSRFVVQVSRAF